MERDLSAQVAVVPDGDRVSRLDGLRINAFAVLVMLLIEFSLGIWVNLDATVPAADHGANPALAIVRAIVNGPVGLSLHALLGVLIVVSATVAVVRALRTGATRWTVLAGVGLAAVVFATLSGARFVGTSQDTASLAMGLFAALAIFCYALILFRAVPVDE